MDEQSIFLTALEKTTAEEQAAWLEEVCAGNDVLKQHIWGLLQRHRDSRNFLEIPPEELNATLLAPSGGDRAALNAGLAATAPEDAAVVVGGAGRSILQVLERTLGSVPQVALRESAAEGPDAMTRPQAKEMARLQGGSRYQLHGEIARGGMGAILKGRDNDLGRDLAIKVLLEEHKTNTEVVQRFIEEAQIGGQLQHPGIAPVYELGQFADQRPFFSMKLVKGETLAKLLARRNSPVEDRGRFIGIFEQVCQTMAYAHSRGVIHRDLKPANIMVGAFGEVQVMDWGLAKVLLSGGVADEKKARDTHLGKSIIQTRRSEVGSDSPGTHDQVGSQTQIGSVMGTPAYMPPEQALGEVDLMDERADVFSLGAILCEILTGQPPYVANDSVALFRKASRGKLDDCRARLDACGADADLTALTKRCLEVEPHDRPRDASVLAEQISAYLQSVETRLRETETARAVQAERLDQQHRAARIMRKMLSGLALVAVVALSTSAVAAVFWQQANSARRAAELSERSARAHAQTALGNALTAQKEAERANQQKRFADESRLQAEAAEKEANTQRILAQQTADYAKQNLYYAEMHLAHQAWGEHRGLMHMRDLLARWLPDPDGLDRRGWEWFYINSLPYQNLQTFSRGGTAVEPCTVAWHMASHRLAEGTATGTIRIWDVDREQVVASWFEPSPWVPYYGSNSWFAWNPDGTQMAAGARDGVVRVRDVRSGRVLRELKGHKSPLVSVAFSSDGTRIAGFGFDGTIKIWTAATGDLAMDISCGSELTAGRWSPNDRQIAAGHMDGSISLVTLSGTEPSYQSVTLAAHPDSIYHLEWSPDGMWLASTSMNDFFVKVWDVSSQKMVLGPLRHSHGITALAWEPDGTRLATGSMDETVKIWNTAIGGESVTLRGHIQSSTSLSWGDGGRLACGGNAGGMWIWNSVTDQAADRLVTLSDRVTTLSWSPQGDRLAIAGVDGTVRVNDATTGESVQSIEAHDRRKVVPQFGLVRSLAWSPDGALLASAGLDGKGSIWDALSGREVYSLPSDQGAVWNVAWSPHGSQLAAGFQSGTICIVEGLPRTPIIHSFQAHLRIDRQFDAAAKRSGVRALAWNPAGDRLASCGFDRLVKVWDPQGKELTRIDSHTGWVLRVAWSPDGRKLASAGADRLIIVSDAETGKSLKTMRGHSDFVDSVAWSPDGSRLASAGLDNSIRIWDPETGQETLVLRGIAGMFHDVAWHPEGTRLGAASSDGQIRVWDATPGLERDRTPRALPYIERRIAAGTASRDERMWYAESFLRLEKYSAAVAAVENDPSSLARLASLLDQQGQASFAIDARAKARSLWQKKLAAEPNHEDSAANLATLLLNEHPELLKDVGPTTDPWTRLAAGYHHIGDTAALNGLLKNHPRAAIAIADRYAAEKNWERAILEYSKLVDESVDAEVLMKRALAYEATEAYELAAADWSRAAKSTPKLAPELSNRVLSNAVRLAQSGTAALMQGKRPEAARELQRALNQLQTLYRSYPDHPPTAHWMAYTLCSLSELPAHEQRFEEGLRLLREARNVLTSLSRPRSLDLYNLACVYGKILKLAAQDAELLSVEERGQCARLAMTSLRRSLATGFEDFSLLQSDEDLTPFRERPEFQGMLLQAMGRTREALSHFARATAADPGDTLLALHTAALQAWFGENGEYAATRQRLLAFAENTQDVQTAEQVAKAVCILPFSVAEEREKAVALAREAVKLGPESGWNLLAAGMAEYRSGQFAKAEASLSAAASRLSFDRSGANTASFYRALSLHQLGQADEARRIALSAKAQMKPLPADSNNPLAGIANHDDLILWLVCKEAQTLLGLGSSDASQTSGR